MRKSSRSQRYRVSTRDAAAYRAIPEPAGVFEIVANMRTISDHHATFQASGQKDEMLGSAAAHHMLGMMLAATPATTAIEAELKMAVLGPFVAPEDAGMPADGAMAAEAIRYERERWNLPAGNPLPN